MSTDRWTLWGSLDHPDGVVRVEIRTAGSEGTDCRARLVTIGPEGRTESIIGQVTTPDVSGTQEMFVLVQEAWDDWYEQNDTNNAALVLAREIFIRFRRADPRSNTHIVNSIYSWLVNQDLRGVFDIDLLVRRLQEAVDQDDDEDLEEDDAYE